MLFFLIQDKSVFNFYFYFVCYKLDCKFFYALHEAIIMTISIRRYNLWIQFITNWVFYELKFKLVYDKISLLINYNWIFIFVIFPSLFLWMRNLETSFLIPFVSRFSFLVMYISIWTETSYFIESFLFWDISKISLSAR